MNDKCSHNHEGVLRHLVRNVEAGREEYEQEEKEQQIGDLWRCLLCLF